MRDEEYDLEIPRDKAINKPVEQGGGNWILDPENFSMMGRIFNDQCPTVHTDRDMQVLYDDVEELIDSTLDRCFRKTKKSKTTKSFADTVHHTHKPLCKVLNKFAARGKVQRKVAQQYREKILEMNTVTVSEINNQKLRKRIENISENERFSAQKFWKEKKVLSSTQRTCNSVYDSRGQEVFEENSFAFTL